jgi:mannose-6-phosphate isomerase-like protein (cupin superfamily)
MSKWVVKTWEMPSVKRDPPHERVLKLLYAPELNEYENATMLLSYIPPGHNSEQHVHQDSDEIMYFFGKGRGTLGDEKFDIEPDVVVLAPKGVPHQFWNTSDTDMMKIICIYVPPVKLSPLLEKCAELGREKIKSQS